MAFLGFIGRFFRKLFGENGWLRKKVIPKVIEVVNNVKEWDQQNPQFADLLTALIPGTWDDDLKNKMRAALKYALEQAGQFMTCLDNTDENQRIACIIKQLQSITNMDAKALVWSNIAAHATRYLSNDGKLDINEISSLIKMVYENWEDNDDDDEEFDWSQFDEKAA